MEFSRQHVVNVLRRSGHAELAEEASRVFPDPVDLDRVVAWAMEHGLSHDDLISQMGGSP
jgi:hypothetical protein